MKAADIDTGINTISDDSMYGISTNEKKLVNRIVKLKELRPDEVIITVNPEDNEGTVVARFPKSWLKINPPREMTDEEKAERVERLKRIKQPISAE